MHPNDAGHIRIAGLLAPIISARIGTTASPTPTPTPTPSATPTPTPTPTTSASCAVRYAVTNQWQGGFQGEVTVTNTGTGSIDGWTLTWSFAGGQQLSQAWNATYAQTGATVTVTGASWNASIPAKGSASFGFIAGQPGINSAPTAFNLSGKACAVTS
ncbi:cellulose-binding domain-containing protein [Streptosporangium sp. NPDC006930]|uniref:cellulose-binding domain-containing protein n=1 Tax=Streptosporangium sp. NPDC006930 TaxID=3154783 RepID=UPI003436EA9C